MILVHSSSRSRMSGTALNIELINLLSKASDWPNSLADIDKINRVIQNTIHHITFPKVKDQEQLEQLPNTFNVVHIYVHVAIYICSHVHDMLWKGPWRVGQCIYNRKRVLVDVEGWRQRNLTRTKLGSTFIWNVNWGPSMFCLVIKEEKDNRGLNALSYFFTTLRSKQACGLWWVTTGSSSTCMSTSGDMVVNTMNFEPNKFTLCGIITSHMNTERRCFYNNLNVLVGVHNTVLRKMLAVVYKQRRWKYLPDRTNPSTASSASPWSRLGCNL